MTEPDQDPNQDPNSDQDQSDSSGGVQDTSPAQPVQVSPGGQEGVQVGGLSYTPNEDGTRNYAGQQQVETVDDPTPTPEQAQPQAPSQQ